MVEIFTVGGGEYIVNVLNAVAAWTGSGGYKSLIQVTMVMGLALAVIVLAFSQDWRAWLNWFLGATAYLYVPDGAAHGRACNRPHQSVARAGASCKRAAWPCADGGVLPARSATIWCARPKRCFGLPNDLDYSRNGMIYGSRLLDATRSLRISDPEFAANLDEHFKQCVFYDLLLGKYSMQEVAASNDIWTVIAPGSQGRAQRFVTRQADDHVSANHRHLPQGLCQSERPMGGHDRCHERHLRPPALPQANRRIGKGEIARRSSHSL